MQHEVPLGIHTAGGVVAVMAVAAAASFLPAGWAWPRTGLVAAGVAVLAAVMSDAAATAFVAITALLMTDGFLINRFGELTWPHAGAAEQLGVIAIGAAVGTVLGLARLWRREYRRLSCTERRVDTSAQRPLPRTARADAVRDV